MAPTDFLIEYLPILVFLVIALGVACAMTLVPFVIGKQKPDGEKLSAYECGFDAFDDARRKFDVRFYMSCFMKTTCQMCLRKGDCFNTIWR